MCDGEVCDASGCYGKCPTSTRCSRFRCQKIHQCPPGSIVQRPGCGCGCRLPAPVKCPIGLHLKDYLNYYHDERIVFKSFHAVCRSTPRMPNKLSQLPKGPDGKPIIPGKKGNGGKGGDGGEGDDGGDGGADGKKKDPDALYDDDDDDVDDKNNGHRSRDPGRRPISKEQKMKNKLSSIFDEALMLGDLIHRGKKQKHTHTSKYYKDKFGIEVSCKQSLCKPY